MGVGVRLYVLICILFVHVSLSTGVTAATKIEPVIGAVVFEGVTVFNPDQLWSVYQPVIGRTLAPVTKSDLVARTRALYVDSGFLEPAVTVRPHASSPSIIRITVAEPRISRIEVINSTGRQSRNVQSSFAPLEQRQPMSHVLIDNTVRSVERLQKIDLETELKPLPGGNAEYLVAVTVRPKLGGALTYTSEGDRRLDRHLVLAQLSVANPISHVRKFGVNGLHSLESDAYRVAGANLELGVSRRNSLSFATKVGRAILDSENGSPDTVYRFRQTESEWAYALTPDAKQDAELYTGLVLRDFTRTQAGVRELDEQLRMADIGLRTLVPGTSRAHRADLSSRFGFNDWGARRIGSEAGDTIEPSFYIARVDYTLWQGFPAGFSMRVDLEGQYSPDELPSSQRFTIGGSRFARAYEPGEFSGDSGYGSNFEFRRGFSGFRWFPGRLTPFVYYGIAVIHRNDTSDRDSAAAAGLGLRVAGDGFAGVVEYGKPLTVGSRYRNEEARLNGRFTVYF